MSVLPAIPSVSNGRVPTWRCAVIAALLSFGTVSIARAQDTAEGWLERLGGAAKSLSYEGTFVYRHEGRMETMRIIHRGENEGEAERLITLTGAPREIIRDEQRVTCIFSDDRSVVVDQRQLSKPFSSIVPGDVPRLSRTYQLELEGPGRIAGRPAQQILIKPRDRLRYGYRLWADRESGLLLRSDLLDEQGEPIEQLMFTELRTPASIPAAALQPQLSGEGFTWYRDPAQPMDGSARKKPAPRWQASDLPEGFELVTHEVRRIAGSAGPVEHMVYSDGLASVSVYIEKGAGQSIFRGRSRMGAVHAFGRVVNDEQITVVGEVPAATVARIGASLQPVAALNSAR